MWRNEILVWAERIELSQALRPNGFSYHFDFRRHPIGCSWSGLSLHHCIAALGAARLVSTPSPKGLARDCQLRVPRIWAVLLRRFPTEHSIFDQVRCVYLFRHAHRLRCIAESLKTTKRAQRSHGQQRQAPMGRSIGMATVICTICCVSAGFV